MCPHATSRRERAAGSVQAPPPASLHLHTGSPALRCCAVQEEGWIAAVLLRGRLVAWMQQHVWDAPWAGIVDPDVWDPEDVESTRAALQTLIPAAGTGSPATAAGSEACEGPCLMDHLWEAAEQLAAELAAELCPGSTGAAAAQKKQQLRLDYLQQLVYEAVMLRLAVSAVHPTLRLAVSSAGAPAAGASHAAVANFVGYATAGQLAEAAQAAGQAVLAARAACEWVGRSGVGVVAACLTPGVVGEQGAVYCRQQVVSSHAFVAAP